MEDLFHQLISAPATHSFISGIVIFLALGYAILIYNNLVRLSRNIEKAWANIDVVLKQRVDELTKLVMVCHEYMSYEQTTLQEIVNCREQVQVAREKRDQKAAGEAESKLRKATKELFALAEAYPQLKAHHTFNELERRVSELEDKISDRREFFNDTVNHYNIRIRSLPDILISGLLGYKKVALMSFPEEETADVKIDMHSQDGGHAK